MQYILPALKTLLYLYLLSILWFFAFHYTPSEPGYGAPFLVFIGDAINLLIHEAGHFFFSMLGRTLYLMGGSILQVLLPAGIAFWVWWNRPEHAAWPIFWTGWNLCNVAIYIGDAPFRKLHLINPALTHDWHAIMNRLGMMESAVLIGEIVHWSGVAVCAGGLALGIKYLVEEFRYARSGEEGD